MKNLKCGGKFEMARNAQDPDESRHGDPPGVSAGRMVHAGWVGGFEKSLGLAVCETEAIFLWNRVKKRTTSVEWPASRRLFESRSNLYVEAEAASGTLQTTALIINDKLTLSA